MATKIKLMRLGKMREPHYRIVVADARTKRDGRSIETIGEYHPKSDPSVISVDGDRAAYWLGVGAQPTEAVTAIFKVTGDWQKFKGLPAPEPMKLPADEAGQAGAVQRRAGRGVRRAGDRRRPPRRRSGPRRRPLTSRPQAPAAEPAAEAPSRPRSPSEPTAPAAEAETAGGQTRPAARRAGERRRADVLEEALEHLVRGIVDHPDDVRVDMVDNRRGQRLEIRVHPDDLGRVIGRNGRTAKALRQVINGVGGKGIRVDVDRRRPATEPIRSSRRDAARPSELVAVGRIGPAAMASAASRSSQPLHRRRRTSGSRRARCCAPTRRTPGR